MTIEEMRSGDETRGTGNANLIPPMCYLTLLVKKFLEQRSM